MLDDVFRRLADPEFQELGAGLMSFPAYVYVYPPDREHEFREAISRLPERLRRPNVGQDPLLVDVFEEFLSYLEAESLSGRPLLDHMLEQEASVPETVDRQLKSQAKSGDFTERLARMFDRHVSEESELDRSYILVHGWGTIYPYLRSSQFLDRMESHMGEYKIILFYPGTYKNGQFRLFGKLSSNRVYRASYLNQMIGA
jgi:AcrR family transcriptional regulator